jgi:hypothetical protein
MQIRDRVKELRRVIARQLRPNSKNWRTHPPAQQDALRGVLAEIGFAGALLARQLDDGSLELVDGQLRAETAPDALVPVLVLDVSAEEADKLLATFDPLGAMAGADPAAVERLLADLHFANSSVEKLVEQIAASDAAPIDPNAGQPPPEVQIPKLFQVIVECENEVQQHDLFERLKSEGHKCRLSIL